MELYFCGILSRKKTVERNNKFFTKKIKDKLFIMNENNKIITEVTRYILETKTIKKIIGINLVPENTEVYLTTYNITNGKIKFNITIPDISKNELENIERKNKLIKLKTKTINFICTMISENNKGLSGFFVDEDGGCGNPNVFSNFKEPLKHGNYARLEHLFCPYDKRILLPQETDSSGSCYYKCMISNFVFDKDIRKKVLERFKINLENGVYDEMYLSHKEHDISLPPLITNEEFEKLENKKKVFQENLATEWKKREEKHNKTIIEKRKNCIKFNGNNLNPLPNELFQLWRVITKKYNKSFLDFRELDETLEARVGYDIHPLDLQDEPTTDHYEGGIIDYMDDYRFQLHPFDTCIVLSEYYDYEINQKLFYIAMGEQDIDTETFYTRNAFCIPTDFYLTNIYNKWKDYRNNNKNKHIQPYKTSCYQHIKDEISFLNSVICETCIGRDYCYGNCLQPERLIKGVKIPKEHQFKINLHILEPCNYRCKHCFAHFNNHKILPINYWKHIVDNCADAILTHEFNIAGGEPLLYKDLDELIEYIHFIKADCSIITNGFLITEEWVKKNAPKLKTIGFSIDSFIPETLIQMGRATNKREYLSKERFSQICKWIREYNPTCKIKVNTVVTSLNKTENIFKTLKENNIIIDKWKIIKMRVFKNLEFDNSNIQITDEEYKSFVEINTPNNIEPTNTNNNSDIYQIENTTIVVEKNVQGGYIIVDANGFLIDNTHEENHTPIINCATEEFIDGFIKMSFDKNLYFSRYKNEDIKEKI